MTNPAERPTPDGHEPEQLTELVEVLRTVDGLMARATRLADEVDGARAVAEEGLPVDTALQLHAGWTRGDVNALLTASDVLARMPVTAGLFDRGVFTWGHVRQLTLAAARFDRPTTERLDEHVGRHAARLEAMEPEQRHWAIEDAIDDHTPERRLERREERDERADVLVLTPRLDGTGTGWFDLNPEAFTTVTGRLTEEADAPMALPCPIALDSTTSDPAAGDPAAGDPATGEPATDGPTAHGTTARADADAAGSSGLPTQRALSRGRQLADALVRICSRHGQEAPTAPVRASLIIDVDRISDRFAGELTPALATRPPRILRRTLDRLSCDADIEVVVRHGTDLLAAKRYQDSIPAATRRALAARDGGCRFPGCRAPIGWTDVHHVIERSRHLDHDLSNVVLLCRRHHTVVHRSGWQQHLTPDGRYRISRRGRSWTTLPRREQQLPPPDPPDPRDHRHAARRRTGSAPASAPPARDPSTAPHRGQPPPGHEPVPF